jgi:hypothetical protein
MTNSDKFKYKIKIKCFFYFYLKKFIIEKKKIKDKKQIKFISK